MLVLDFLATHESDNNLLSPSKCTLVLRTATFALQRVKVESIRILKMPEAGAVTSEL